MSSDPSALSVFLFITALLSFWLGVYALRQQATTFARYYAGLMFCATAYTIGYGLELMSTDWMRGWAMLRIQYLGIPFVPFFWIGLAWSYLEPRGMPERWRWFFLIISGGLFLAFQTNPLHQNFYTSLTFSRTDGVTISLAGKGSMYWLNIAYLNLSTALGVILLFRAWRQAIPLYRKQALMLLAGSFLPWTFHLLYQLGLSPRGIDLSPFGIAATGAAFAIATLRHKVLNILPLARDFVFDSIAQGVIVLDTRQRIVDFNRAATTFFPPLQPAMIGAEYRLLSDIPDITQIIKSQKPFIHTAGKQKLEIHPHPLTSDGDVLIGTALLIQDITEKLARLDELRLLATTDELTGLYNRRHLLALSEREIQLAQRHPRPLSVIILDLDDFKAVNDGNGHLAGDSLLKDVARTLEKRLRATDILGRYGGDEFIITLPETTGEKARQIATVLNQHCREECGIGLSMGIAELDPGSSDFAELLRRADLALYRAKDSGKNQALLYHN